MTEALLKLWNEAVGTVMTLPFPIQLYLGAGVVVALGFVTFGVGRVAREAHGFAPGFRLFIIPAVILMWPYVVALLVGAVRRKA